MDRTHGGLSCPSMLSRLRVPKTRVGTVLRHEIGLNNQRDGHSGLLGVSSSVLFNVYFALGLCLTWGLGGWELEAADTSSRGRGDTTVLCLLRGRSRGRPSVSPHLPPRPTRVALALRLPAVGAPLSPSCQRISSPDAAGRQLRASSPSVNPSPCHADRAVPGPGTQHRASLALCSPVPQAPGTSEFSLGPCQKAPAPCWVACLLPLGGAFTAA